MDIFQALKVIKHFNSWRRNGGELELEYSPYQISVALDVLILNSEESIKTNKN